MEDAAFVKQFLANLDFLAHSMPKQMTAFKDINSIVTYCSDYYAECLDVSPKEILGTVYSSFLYGDDMSFGEIILAEDQAVIQKREAKMILKIHRFKKNFMPYLCLKTPVINPSTNQVVGILVEGIEIGLSGLIQKLLLNPNPSKQQQIDPATLPHLSKREKQVIFLFLANLSSQAIADMLYKLEGKKVSKSTIDSLFNDQLYAKFNVYSRPALYKKLQELGYETLVPKELLKNTSALLDAANTY